MAALTTMKRHALIHAAGALALIHRSERLRQTRATCCCAKPAAPRTGGGKGTSPGKTVEKPLEPAKPQEPVFAACSGGSERLRQR
jgi:hypothetical protein